MNKVEERAGQLVLSPGVIVEATLTRKRLGSEWGLEITIHQDEGGLITSDYSPEFPPGEEIIVALNRIIKAMEV